MKFTADPKSLSDEATKLAALDAEHRRKGYGRMEFEEWMVPAAQEIADANLGWFHHSDELRYCSMGVYRLHSQFTQHVGMGREYPCWDATVTIVDPEVPDYDPHHRLLLRAEGARIESLSDRTRAPSRHRLIVRHPTGTDYEHDAMILASLHLVGLEVAYYGTAAIEHYAMISEARLWPNGADPFADDEVNGECSYEHCTPHRFGPYLPPEREGVNALAGKMVKIVLSMPEAE